MAKVIWIFIITTAVSLTLTLAFAKNVTIINVKSSESYVHHTLKDNPIVVHTQAQNYEHPTLSEYEECHRNLDNCKEVCKNAANQTDCEGKCPVCPILIAEQILVQGVNDTDYRAAPTKPSNTTNIIRVTNEIHNIIDNQLGNVTHNSLNNIHIHQNVSRVGGKFGFGFNHTQPCCLVVRSSKNCDKSKFSTAARCHHKRHRVCGEKCKARVMFAKRVKVCERSVDDDDNVSEEHENCHQATKYVPYHKRTQSRKLKCFYQPRWPYVSCPNRGSSTRSKSCERCYRLPYGRILLYGVPAQCINCFQRYSYSSGFGASMYPSYYPPMIGSWPMIMNDNFGEYDDDDDFEGVEIKDDDLVDEETKCRLPDGSRSDDCTEIEGSGEDFEIDNDLRSGNKRPINDSAEKLTEPHFTLRGHSYTFNRSKYSRRGL
ncbi:uncharacterized protein LOC119638958 isoform X1 [Glossina fuscipes]|uniref:Uncharacterized protein LOC119638958 isoform X1 n=1 Tax=Glossina fuscipes TaxID=7396 RepID=A0A9C5Z8U2_9MUSC|nr:uncharacterized protein LOC119638958 isoform X1 [Glossina fuscipes]